MKYKAKLASNTECDLDCLDAQAGLSLKAIQSVLELLIIKKHIFWLGLNFVVLNQIKFCWQLISSYCNF